MGLLDILFGGNYHPTVGSILPDAAKNEIMAGRLPRLNTDNLFFKRGEYCCYIEKALLLEEKKEKIYRHFGGSTPGLFEGNRVGWGVGDSKEIVKPVEHKAILYITNQRIILQCKELGFDKPFKSLSAIKSYTNAIELQFGSKTYSIIVNDGTIPHMVLKIIEERRLGY